MDGLRPSSVLLSMTMVWPVASLCRMYIFRGALAVKDDDSTVLSQSSISPSDEPLAAWLAVEDETGDGSAAAEEIMTKPMSVSASTDSTSTTCGHTTDSASERREAAKDAIDARPTSA